MKTPSYIEVYTPAGKFKVTCDRIEFRKSYSIICRDYEFEREVHHHLNLIDPENQNTIMFAMVYSDNNEIGEFETMALRLDLYFEPFDCQSVAAQEVLNFRNFIDFLSQSGQLDFAHEEDDFKNNEARKW